MGIFFATRSSIPSSCRQKRKAVNNNNNFNTETKKTTREFFIPPPPKSRFFSTDGHAHLFPDFFPQNFQTEKNAAVVPDQHVTFSNSSASFDFAHILFFPFFLRCIIITFSLLRYGGENLYVCTDIFWPTQKVSFFAYIDTGMGENSNDVVCREYGFFS